MVDAAEQPRKILTVHRERGNDRWASVVMLESTGQFWMFLSDDFPLINQFLAVFIGIDNLHPPKLHTSIFNLN